MKMHALFNLVTIRREMYLIQLGPTLDGKVEVF